MAGLRVTAIQIQFAGQTCKSDRAVAFYGDFRACTGLTEAIDIGCAATGLNGPSGGVCAI